MEHKRRSRSRGAMSERRMPRPKSRAPLTRPPLMDSLDDFPSLSVSSASIPSASSSAPSSAPSAPFVSDTNSSQSSPPRLTPTMSPLVLPDPLAQYVDHMYMPPNFYTYEQLYWMYQEQCVQIEMLQRENLCLQALNLF